MHFPKYFVCIFFFVYFDNFFFSGIYFGNIPFNKKVESSFYLCFLCCMEWKFLPFFSFGKHFADGKITSKHIDECIGFGMNGLLLQLEIIVSVSCFFIAFILGMYATITPPKKKNWNIFLAAILWFLFFSSFLFLVFPWRWKIWLDIIHELIKSVLI